MGPRYGVDKPAKRLRGSAYQNSLDLALSRECQSIAFPAISCGVYGYPLKEAARIAVTVSTRPEYDLLKKYFYLFSEDMATIWIIALENHCQQ